MNLQRVPIRMPVSQGYPIDATHHVQPTMKIFLLLLFAYATFATKDAIEVDRRRQIQLASVLSKAVYEKTTDIKGINLLKSESLDKLGIHWYLGVPEDSDIDEVYVAFPGSNFSDVRQLATNLNVQTNPSGLHKGFAAVRPRDLPMNLLKKHKRVILCGHSKGGGHAHALHHQLRRTGELDDIISIGFGTPYFVSSRQKLTPHHDSYIQVIIPSDPVPKILDDESPLKGLVALFAGLFGGGGNTGNLKYEPAGQHWFLNPDGLRIVSAHDNIEAVRKLLKVSEPGDLTHHGVRNYVKQTKRLLRMATLDEL